MSKQINGAMGLILLALVGTARATPDLSVSADAAGITPGSLFSIDVNISGAADLYGYQFDLSFNPTIISAVSSSEGSLLASGGSTFFVSGTNDNVNGTVSATADTLLSPVPGVNGSGNLVVLTFAALKSGVSSVVLSGIDLIDSAFNSIDAQFSNSAVTVAPQAAISAPEVDPASAASALTFLLGSLAVLRGRTTSIRLKHR